MGVLDETVYTQRFTPAATDWPETQGSGRLIGARELMSLARRRRLLIAMFGLSGLLLSLLAIHELSPSYKAQSMILLEPDDPNLLDDAPDQAVQQPNSSKLDTEADLMTSRSFAGRVVDELNLIAEPEFNTYLVAAGSEQAGASAGWLRSWLLGVSAAFGQDEQAAEPLPPSSVQRDSAITVLLSRLNTSRSGESSVMVVSAVDEQPERAALIANTTTGLFVDWSRDQKREEMKEAADFLRQQAGELATRIGRIEQEIAEYGGRNQVSSDPRDDLLRLAMQQANEQLSAARGDLTQARARLAQAQAAAAGGVRSGMDQLLSSDFLRTLRTEEATALGERADLARSFAQAHPQIQRADAKIASVRALMSEEFQRILAGMEGDVRIAEGRVADFERDLEAATVELRQRSLAEIRLRELNRDLLTEQKLYDVTASRLGKLDPFAAVAKANARVVSVAEVPTSPYFPKPRMLVGGGVVGALVLGFVVAVTLESLDTRIRDGRGAAGVAGAPLLASIPRLRRRLGSRKTDLFQEIQDSPHALPAEAFRALFRSCRRMVPKDRPQSVLLTSALPSEGASPTAAGLAAAAALLGARTVLIDLDPRCADRPISLSQEPVGPSSFAIDRLERGFDIADGLKPVSAIPSLSILEIAEGDSRLVGEDALETLLFRLRESCEFVVIAAPPVLCRETAVWAGAHVDTVLLVASWNRTSDEKLAQAGQRLRLSGIEPRGLVIDQVEPEASSARRTRRHRTGARS
ncbi:GumC family protein [Aureimonas phyllosphaerae]|uniref:GumC family protein n=1 Tax=Aureimonas phyllosphaerae TaxID=1166078 RepID=UPI003A5BE8D5